MYAAQSLVRVCKHVHACASVCVPAQRPVQRVRSQCIHHSPRLGTVPGPVTASGAGWCACSLQWQPAAPPRVTSGTARVPKPLPGGRRDQSNFCYISRMPFAFPLLPHGVWRSIPEALGNGIAATGRRGRQEPPALLCSVRHRDLGKGETVPRPSFQMHIIYLFTHTLFN